MNKKQYIAPAIEIIRLQTEAPLAASAKSFYDEFGYGQMSVDSYEESNSMTNEEIWGKEW